MHVCRKRQRLEAEKSLEYEQEVQVEQGVEADQQFRAERLETGGNEAISKNNEIEYVFQFCHALIKMSVKAIKMYWKL